MNYVVRESKLFGSECLSLRVTRNQKITPLLYMGYESQTCRTIENYLIVENKKKSKIISNHNDA